MNIDEIITKYKEQPEVQLYRLVDGGIVVGTEIDEQNYLYYVIRRDDVYSVEIALGQQIIEKFTSPIKSGEMTSS